MRSLVGEDLNRNGVLDPNENDENHDGLLEPGLLEYVTVYSREPNTRADGSPRINIRVVTGTTGPLPSLLQSIFGSTRANQVLTRLGLVSNPSPGAAARAPATVLVRSPSDFYVRSGLTLDEFPRMANEITVSTGPYLEGRINVNTASLAVLACLPGISSNPDLAQTLVNYRQANPDKLTSIAWVAEALGQNNA